MATPISERRRAAVDAVIRSIRTGEHSASLVAAKFLAPEVVLNANGSESRDRAAVIDRISGQWAFTPVLAQGEWSLPENLGDKVRVGAEVPGLGAAPSDYSLTFGFEGDLISRIDEKYSFQMTTEPVDHMPAHVRTAINRALANQTPMVLADVDEDRAPSLSLRGSVQVYSPTQLCLWVRNPRSGLIASIRAQRPSSFLYRNSPSRTTLTIRGRGKLVDDPKIRRQIFELSPEVEQPTTQRWRARRCWSMLHGSMALLPRDRCQCLSASAPIVSSHEADLFRTRPDSVCDPCRLVRDGLTPMAGL